MTRTKAPWVKVSFNPPRTFCERCGQEHPIPLPMALKAAVRYFEAMAMAHKDCKERPV